MYYRYLKNKIESSLQPGKVLILYGPRQVGKTFLINTILADFARPYFLGFGEDKATRDVLESESITTLRSYFSGYDLIIIDEAQKVENIGAGLKLLVDHIPDIKVLATGSSSFDLANKTGEPLTGRKKTLTLYPISALELKQQFGPMEVGQLLEELLIFGSYPETLGIKNNNERVSYLNELRDSYLYKDILELENLRNSRKLSDLLTLLAFQVGKEVSLSELGSQVELSKQTVERYLDLLEKAFVIKNVRGFSRNLRKEVTKTSRYYFFDNGVRNSVINNFNPLSLRNDIGMLWENFLFIERMKKQDYVEQYSNYYFWRTYDKQEIDLIEEQGGQLSGFEFSYKKAKRTIPRDWKNSYPNATYDIITKDNFLPFIT